MNKKPLDNLWQKKLLLLLLTMLPFNLMAQDEYPNMLVIHQTDGSEIVHLLEEIKMYIYPGEDRMEFYKLGNYNGSIKLSTITGIRYEFRDAGSLGISSITLSDASGIEVYGLDGRRHSSDSPTLQGVLNRLPQGVYIIKKNGKAIKVAK